MHEASVKNNTRGKEKNKKNIKEVTFSSFSVLHFLDSLTLNDVEVS